MRELHTHDSTHATMNDNPIWKMRVEGLKRHAHDNRWGREALRQWAQEGLMDEAPDVAAMIEQWPQRYTDLPPDAWPAALADLGEEAPRYAFCWMSRGGLPCGVGPGATGWTLRFA